MEGLAVPAARWRTQERRLVRGAVAAAQRGRGGGHLHNPQPLNKRSRVRSLRCRTDSSAARSRSRSREDNRFSATAFEGGVPAGARQAGVLAADQEEGGD